MRILITAGPTREAIDPVRYITNASSGKMGYAVAVAARARGHRVTLVTGPVRLSAPRGVKIIRVTTALEMRRAVLREQARHDAFIATAAVGDFRPAKFSARKIKKTGDALTMQFIANPDILAEVARKWRAAKKRKILVGFALENHEPLAHARAKLKQKQLDAVVLNTPASFDSRFINATLLRPGAKPERFGKITKSKLAKLLIRLLIPKNHGNRTHNNE